MAIEQVKFDTFGKSGNMYDGTFYDTADLVSTSSLYTLFQTGIGGSVTKAKTNMTLNGQLPTNVDQAVSFIGVRLFQSEAAGAADTEAELNLLMKFLSQATLTFNIVGKDNLGEWPVSEWLPAFSLSSNAAAGSQQAPSSGVGFSGWKKLLYPIALEGQASFSIALNFYGTLTAAIDNHHLRVMLRGPVQRRG